jgi:molybdenum cofactor cytidylyltransferase
MSSNPDVEAYLLAAGRSERMGESKPMMKFGDSTVIARMIAAFREGGCENVRVIGRADDEPLAREAFVARARYIINLDPSPGMVSSVLEALDDCRARFLLLCPADMPLIGAQTVSAIIARRADCSTGVQPSCGSRLRHPVLLRLAATLPLRNAIARGETLRDFLAMHPLDTVEFDDELQFADMDTPDDFRRLASLASERQMEPGYNSLPVAE